MYPMIEDLVLYIPSDEGLESWNVINSIGTVGSIFLLFEETRWDVRFGCQGRYYHVFTA